VSEENVMRTCGLAAFIILLTAGLPARADDESHRQAAEELLRAMRVDKQMESALEQTLDVSIKSQPSLKPYREVMRKFFAKHIGYDALKEDLVKIYVEEFTEPELRQILAFYKTPAGKKMVEKSPALMSKSMQLSMERVSKNQDELKQMIEAEVKKRQEKK
jgi:hypothetical protein